MDIELSGAQQQSSVRATQKQVNRSLLNSNRFRQQLGGVMTHALLIIASLISLFPLGLIVLTSLKPESQSLLLNFKPQDWSLDNYRYVLNDGFLSYARNSVYVSVLTMLIALSITLPAGYALSRFEFIGKQGVMLSFLITQMFPAPLLLVPLYALFIQFHLLNTHLGLVLAYTTTALPFSAWMLKNFFDTIPRDLDEAAMIDGLNVWRTFYQIIVPLTIPGIAVVAFYNFMNAWNEFMFANLFLTADPSVETLPLGLTHYVFATGAHWQWLTAFAVLVMIPVMGFFFWAQRYLVSGLTSGSVKG